MRGGAHSLDECGAMCAARHDVEDSGVKAVKGSKIRKRQPAAGNKHRLLPVLAAVSSACGLAAAPADALELGEIRMESTLGQPLRASITYALNPNEQLHEYCIYLRPGTPGGPIPSVTRAGLSVSGNRIVVTGSQPVTDPLLSLQIAVDCPYTPNLARQYTMIVDPVLPLEEAPMFASAQLANEPVRRAAATVAATPRPATRTQAMSAPASRPMLAAGTEYRVQSGDTASTIAARVEGRDVSLRTAVDMLVAANPAAFVRGNADRIMAGSLLMLPEMTGAYDEPSAATVAAEVFDAAHAEPVSVDPVPEAVDPEPPLAVEPAFSSAVPITEPVAPFADPVAEPVTEPEAVSGMADAAASEAPVADEIAEPPVVEEAATQFANMKPGDVFVAPPADARVAPVVVSSTVTAGSDTQATTGAWSKLALAAGAGVVLLAGMLFFGRRLRDRFGSVAINAPATPDSPEKAPSEKRSNIVDDVDFQFDDTISEEAVSLDADLGAGTGLGASGELDVSQDFTFDAVAQDTRDIDLELTEEAAAEPEPPTTDIIPPTHKVEEATILDGEITPESDDYDMSMIVDATKQSIDYDDATAKDLQAVPVESDLAKTGEYEIADDTMATEADLKALELDYEEEFTQTQALNKEIEQAAQELAARLDPEELAEALGSDPGLEPTAEMPTGNGEEFTAELTASLPVDADAVNDDIADDDITSKMAAAGSDVTVEMQIESGSTVDTKKTV
jgi:hypothetical protein